MTVLDYLEVKGKKVGLDEGGYLAEYADWSEEAAQALAQREGAGRLTEEQLDMLRFIREYYQKFNYFPILNAVCKNVHLPKDCVKQEFPNPLLAWKLAGLPRPDEPIVSLLEAGQSPG